MASCYDMLCGIVLCNRFQFLPVFTSARRGGSYGVLFSFQKFTTSQGPPFFVPWNSIEYDYQVSLWISMKITEIQEDKHDY